VTTSPGRFLTFEGIEGVGKSTQIARLATALGARGIDVLVTREPGGTPLAESIRALVLQPREETLPPIAELLLMFAARAAHWHATIEPALAAGRDVVCDRFIDSSFAYQVWGKGIAEDKLQVLQTLAIGDAVPDLTLLFDLDPELGLARARDRGDENRFEQESQAFRQRVRAGFLARAEAEPTRVRVIDAERDTETVSAAIIELLEALPAAPASSAP